MKIRWIHQSGVESFAELAAEFKHGKYDGCAVEFLEDMPKAFAEADLIICRSGAGTVSELAAAGKPSVLVPFPFASDQHQLKNAEAMRDAGAAKIVLDQEMTGERMVTEIRTLSEDRPELERMGNAARRLARPEALKRAVDVLEEAAK